MVVIMSSMLYYLEKYEYFIIIIILLIVIAYQLLTFQNTVEDFNYQQCLNKIYNFNITVD